MSDDSGFGDVLGKIQEMQQRLAEFQEQAAARTAEASAGGGMVKAVVNGRLQLVSLAIEPQVLESGDREMLQDLVMAAVNQAIRKAQELMAQEMQKLTGGLAIPGLTP